MRVAGPAGELGPLGGVYAAGGFAPVAMTKLLALLAVLVIFTLYTRRVGSPRRLALMVAVVGLFGAADQRVRAPGRRHGRRAPRAGALSEANPSQGKTAYCRSAVHPAVDRAAIAITVAGRSATLMAYSDVSGTVSFVR